MSAYKSVYKKYQCRYFDEQGKPLNPKCKQGDTCRFVHPSDPHWPGLKYMEPFKRTHNTTHISREDASFDSRNTGGSYNFSSRTTSKATTKSNRHSPKSRSERYSIPLVSQTDLFLQCKVETNDAMSDGKYNRKNEPSLGDSHSLARSQDRRKGHDSSSTGPFTPGRDRGSHRSKEFEKSVSYRSTNSTLGPFLPNLDAKIGHTSPAACEHGEGRSQSNARETQPVLDKEDVPSTFIGNPLLVSCAKQNEAVGVMCPPEQSDSKDHVERLVDLFRGLARLSNQATQNIRDQEKEEKKLQTYTDLSSTLSKISTSAASTIVPTVADILLRHAQCKQLAQENFTAIGSMWEEAFDVFVKEIAHVIDSHLETTLTALRKEAEKLQSSIRMSSISKREEVPSALGKSENKRSQTRRSSEETDMGLQLGYERSSSSRKRRRLTESTLFEVGQQESRSNLNASSDAGGSNKDHILSQMKCKMDQQAQSLLVLAQENARLKATLYEQSVAGPNRSDQGRPSTNILARSKSQTPTSHNESSSRDYDGNDYHAVQRNTPHRRREARSPRHY